MRPVDADKVIENIDEWLDSVGYATVGKGLSYYGELIGCVDETPTITPSDWVSVEDRLPSGNGRYIVCACDANEPLNEQIWGDTVVICAEYYDKCWTWYEGICEYDLDGLVTHWMPLPEPPKED